MDPTRDWYVWTVRGKPVTFDPHALDGQSQEARQRPVTEKDVARTLETPDALVPKKGGKAEARKWISNRTVIVRYVEYEDRFHVYSISATRRRLAP